MATTSLSLQRGSRSRAKYLLFAFIGLMLAYVLHHNESFLIHSDDPVWQHYHPFRWYLLPHGVAGACALLLGPLQFSERLRGRFTKFHRVVGRIYIGGVLVAAPMGFYVQFFQERMGGTRSFSIVAAVQATSWILTTLIALAFIRAGKVQQHRQWMTRSFAVALIFLEVRVILGLAGWDNNPVMAEVVVWTCNAFAIFSADVVLQLQEIWRSRPAPAKAQAAAQ
jgi:uncharacterized membrane protein